MTTIESAEPRTKGRLRAILLSTVLVSVIASVANAIVAVAGLAAGADPAVQGLTPPAYITFTVLGALIGAIGWSILSRASQGRRLLTVLVPTVLVLSLIPDVALAATVGVTAAVTLGIMHVVTVAVAVPVYRAFMPVGESVR